MNTNQEGFDELSSYAITIAECYHRSHHLNGWPMQHRHSYRTMSTTLYSLLGKFYL